MSEIKTIKGKVLFLCVPLDKDGIYKEEYEEQILTMDSIEDRFHLSEITEEQASLLVDCHWKANETAEYKTAKESLFSLFKVNDCLTKQMALDGSYYHAYIFDEVGQTKQQDVILRWEENNEGLERKVFAKPIEELPDDYLLIIKQ